MKTAFLYIAIYTRLFKDKISWTEYLWYMRDEIFKTLLTEKLFW